jgi:hypothetical protein
MIPQSRPALDVQIRFDKDCRALPELFSGHRGRGAMQPPYSFAPPDRERIKHPTAR